jgi:hypothetical protein
MVKEEEKKNKSLAAPRKERMAVVLLMGAPRTRANEPILSIMEHQAPLYRPL